jgi:hypothetical protein
MAVTAVVAKSLTFTNDTTSFQWLLDPSLPALSDLDQVVTLNVKTNASAGYTVGVKSAGLSNGSTSAYTIAAVSSGVAVGVATGSFPANRYGYKMTVTPGSGSLSAADRNPLDGSGLDVDDNFVGYKTVDETAVTATGATGNNGDSIVITNRVKIDFVTEAGTYTDTITYVITPSYS